MTAYEPELWHEFFVMTGGAAAALAGLIFVAVSVNDEPILKTPALPALAVRTRFILIGLVILCIIGLVPGQNRGALGAEILLVGIVLVGVTLALELAAGIVVATSHAWILLIVIRR